MRYRSLPALVDAAWSAVQEAAYQPQTDSYWSVMYEVLRRRKSPPWMRSDLDRAMKIVGSEWPSSRWDCPPFVAQRKDPRMTTQERAKKALTEYRGAIKDLSQAERRFAESRRACDDIAMAALEAYLAGDVRTATLKMMVEYEEADRDLEVHEKAVAVVIQNYDAERIEMHEAINALSAENVPSLPTSKI